MSFPRRGAPPPRRRLAPLLLVAGFALVSIIARNAAAQPQNRGSVSVLIVADDGRRTPVAGAEVTLTTTWTRIDEGEDLDLSATTGDDGTSTLTDVPDGRYVLLVRKPGYVTTAFGTSVDDAAPTPVVVTGGKRVPQLTVALSASASVSGRVLDPRGAPAAHAFVRLMAFGDDAHRFAMASPAADRGALVRAEADDTGAYRLSGLPRGTYLVQASAVDVDDDGEPVVTRAYYPAAAESSGASALTIEQGQDLSTIDIRLQPLTRVSVSGTIDGLPLPRGRSLRVLMYPEGLFSAESESHAAAVMESGDGALASPIQTLADGSFVATDIAPGQYEIWARSMPPNETAESDPDAAVWGHAYVSVGGNDLANVHVPLQFGAVVSGRVAFDSTVSQAVRSRTIVMLVPTEPAGSRARTLRVPAAIDADGTFRMGGVTPGRYTFAVSGPDHGVALVDATSAGRDMFEQPFDLAADESLANALLRAAAPAPPISGVLLDDTNAGLGGLWIVAFPEAPALWTSAERRIRGAKTATDGTFVLTDLIPGRYRIAATTTPPDTTPARETLEAMSRASIAFTLTSHDVADVVIRVARGTGTTSAP